ncbi:MAG: hypothetical protein JNM63_06420 [Spirochaetia bacterium]|nr:hypothetical protein [Spirochaetia bacterium]
MNPKGSPLLFLLIFSGILFSQTTPAPDKGVSAFSSYSNYTEKTFEIRSPKNGESVRKNLRLELAGEWAFPLRGLLLLSNQNRVFARSFEVKDAASPLLFPIRDFASETYDLRVALADDSNRTLWVDKVEGVRILRNVSIFLLGSRPPSLYGVEEQKEQDRTFAQLLQLFTRESRVSSLNIEGAYGRFGTARAVRDILKRAPASDLNLFYVDLPWYSKDAFNGFLSQDYALEKKETLIGPEEFLPAASNSFFLFRFPGGTLPEDPLFTSLSFSAHSNPLYFRLEDFYRNARGAEPLVKPWNALSDLKDFLSIQGSGDLQKEASFAGRLDSGLSSTLLRAYRWVPGQVRSNVSSVPVYTMVTNDSRPVLVTRNFVTYQALRTGAVSKVQTDLRVDIEVKTTPGHWEE